MLSLEAPVPRTALGAVSKPAPRRLLHTACCCLPHVQFGLLAGGLYGRGYWLLLPVIFLLLVIPLLDLLTGWEDTDHFEAAEFSWVERALLRWNTRLYVVFYMGVVTWLALNIERFNALEISVLVVTCSLMAGIGFAAAHELLHAKERIDQWLQRVTTSFLFYPHYKIIHVRSHHVQVGTAHDENTAWLNESVYAYIWRTIPGSFRRCWQLETRFMAEGSGVRWRNRMVYYVLGQLGILGAFYACAGWSGLLFYLAQLAGAHLVLESVNYIQHYGLLRRKQNGEYEKTGPEHSWDTYHFFSSYVAFRVGHHSYHHLAVQPYYLLGVEPKAPRLPTGYFWAIAMVWVPPWWRRVIHPSLNSACR